MKTTIRSFKFSLWWALLLLLLPAILGGLSACSGQSRQESTAAHTLPDGIMPGGVVPTQAPLTTAATTTTPTTTTAPTTTPLATSGQPTQYEWQIHPASVTDLEGELEGFDYTPYLPVPENVNRTGAALDYLYQHNGINHVGGGQQVLSLSFTLVSENGYTARLLDILQEKGVQATFLISMKDYLSSSDEAAELIRRMAREGHAVGSHGYTYIHSTMATNRRFLNELLLFQAELDNILRYHYPVTLFGAPYEAATERDIYLCDLMGIHFLGYSYLLADDNGQAPVYMVLPLLKSALAPGSIMQMHISEGNAEAVADFIDYATEQGYRFVLPES